MFTYFSIIKPELPTNTPPVSSSTTTPVSTGISEGAVKQLKKELDSLKKELESLKSLKKEVKLLKSNYPKSVEILTSDWAQEGCGIASWNGSLEKD